MLPRTLLGALIVCVATTALAEEAKSPGNGRTCDVAGPTNGRPADNGSLPAPRGTVDSNTKTFALRYKFQPGEEVRWQTNHRTQIRTTVAGTTQRAETTSVSTKVWRVKEVKADGTAVFEHSVADVDMRQQLAGCKEVRYNSRTDKAPPVGFDNVAGAVGVPLSLITLSPRGEVVAREQKDVKASTHAEGNITIPLPEQPVAIGEGWSRESEVTAKDNAGRVVKVQLLQRFTLDEVKTGVARIRMVTDILTPMRDRAVEAQVVQCAPSGEVKFDIEAGRIRSQQTDVDKSVVGFRGDASSIHYMTRFSEELLPSQGHVAAD